MGVARAHGRVGLFFAGHLQICSYGRRRSLRYARIFHRTTSFTLLLQFFYRIACAGTAGQGTHTPERRLNHVDRRFAAFTPMSPGCRPRGLTPKCATQSIMCRSYLCFADGRCFRGTRTSPTWCVACEVGGTSPAGRNAPRCYCSSPRHQPDSQRVRSGPNPSFFRHWFGVREHQKQPEAGGGLCRWPFAIGYFGADPSGPFL